MLKTYASTEISFLKKLIVLKKMNIFTLKKKIKAINSYKKYIILVLVIVIMP